MQKEILRKHPELFRVCTAVSTILAQRGPQSCWLGWVMIAKSEKQPESRFPETSHMVFGGVGDSLLSVPTRFQITQEEKTWEESHMGVEQGGDQL